MTVYELIKELTEYGPEQKVVFDAFIPCYEIDIDLGERKRSGEITINKDLDISMGFVDDICEKKIKKSDGVEVHIAVTC